MPCSSGRCPRYILQVSNISARGKAEWAVDACLKDFVTLGIAEISLVHEEAYRGALPCRKSLKRIDVVLVREHAELGIDLDGLLVARFVECV